MSDLPAELGRLGPQRVLVVSASSTKAVADEICHALGRLVGARIAEVHPHVPREEAEEARAVASEQGVDLVLTVGGGSVTGLGKAVVLDLDVPLVAVPTTYAGSEATPIYGVTDSFGKRTGRDERVLPRVVVYDPELTTSLSPRVTASSGMNAIAHCVESLYASKPSPIARTLALEAIRMLRESLPATVHDPGNRAARTGALYGAYLAGTVLATTGMAIHHRICHVLGGRFGLSHGDVNAVVLPQAVDFNEPAAGEAMARVAKEMGGEDAASSLFDFVRTVGGPTSLRELGFDESGLEEAASLTIAEDFYNPRPVDLAAARHILEAAFRGRRPGGAEART